MIKYIVNNSIMIKSGTALSFPLDLRLPSPDGRWLADSISTDWCPLVFLTKTHWHRVFKTSLISKNDKNLQFFWLPTFRNLVFDESTDHPTEREGFETEYFNLIAKVKNYINKNATQNETQYLSTHSKSPFPKNNILIRLPTINLPSFSGNYEEWIS